MLAHLLKSVYRTLTRHRLYTVLSVSGLALGFAVFLLLLLVARFEASFDRWIPHSGEIYRLNANLRMPGAAATSSGTVQSITAPFLSADYSDIETLSRVMSSTAFMRINDEVIEQPIRRVDSNFFRVFELPFAGGDRRTAMTNPSSVVLNETQAAKLFPDGSALGKTLNLTIDGVERAYKVTGILRDMPANSSLPLAIVIPLSRAEFDPVQAAQTLDSWNAFSVQIFARIRTPDAAAKINSDLQSFVRRRVPPGVFSEDPSHTLDYAFIPLASIHFADAKDPSAEQSADPVDVAVLALVGFMTLAIACLNYVNLATARASLRAREVAIRKTVGANRRQLALQFIVEAMVLTSLAAVFGLALAETLVPVVNAYGGTRLQIRYLGFDGVLALTAATALLVGLAAGAWPALTISRYQPASVLALALSPGGGRAGSRLRSGLVFIQFAVALTLAMCTTTMMAQSYHLRHADLGFSRDGLLIVDRFWASALEGRREGLMSEIRRIPGVVSVTTSTRSPATKIVMEGSLSLPGAAAQSSSVVIEEIGPGYFDTYKVRLIAGRTFDPKMRADDLNVVGGVDGVNVILSETAVRALGLKHPRDAIGQSLRFDGNVVKVVGVVGDVRFRSPEDVISPAIYLYRSGDIPIATLAIRYEGEAASIRASVRDVWRGSAPTLPFDASAVPELLAPFYKPVEQRSRLLAGGSLFTILIGSLGLFGLAAFVTTRRWREIGIRKVLGARSSQIFLVLGGELLRPVAAASIIACPLSFMLMSRWLERYDDRITMTPTLFIGPVLAALFIAAITVLAQVIRTAAVEPARVLRAP